MVNLTGHSKFILLATDIVKNYSLQKELTICKFLYTFCIFVAEIQMQTKISRPYSLYYSYILYLSYK